MDDKLKVFWNLDVLVKMCRSKSDGPSLRIEEVEIEEKIKAYKQEIEEINSLTEEESYDTSAEMADRNIEIITKKQLQTLKSNLKEKNKELSELKQEEQHLYTNTSLLRETKSSQEKYITSMQERINEASDYEVIDRYNSLIAETTEKITRLSDEIEEQAISYDKVQSDIIRVTEDIRDIEEKIDKKKKLLAETQANLENKDNYIDKTKREKNNKRIYDLETKIQKLVQRQEEIKKDPKYLESKIKDVINNREDPNNAKKYLVELINVVIRQPYINVPADNNLEEELLKATQARDTFANEMDQKSYNILEADTPEKVRIEFLTERILKWQNELKELRQKVDIIDKDQEFDYESKNQVVNAMIQTMKNDLIEFQRAYDETPDINISSKVSLKAQLDEKRVDILEAEKIATSFRKDESDDIARATRTIKYECEQINQNILSAETEISNIKNRLTSKKAGLIDISAKNKDKDALKELAQIVIDIKHRRQFPETPIEIISRLEESLGLDLIGSIDREIIENTSSIVTKDYEEYTIESIDAPIEVKVTSDLRPNKNGKRGIKVITEAIIAKPIETPDIELVEEIDDEEIDYENTRAALGARIEEQVAEIEKNHTEEVEEIHITEEAQPELTEPELTTEISIEQPIELEIPVAEEPVIEPEAPIEYTEIVEQPVVENEVVEEPIVTEEPVIETEIAEEIVTEPETTEPEEVVIPEVEDQPVIEQTEEPESSEITDIIPQEIIPTEEIIPEEVEEAQNEEEVIELTVTDKIPEDDYQDDELDKEIDAIISQALSSPEPESADDENALDIGAIIDSVPTNNVAEATQDPIVNKLSINSIFSNKNTNTDDENDDNIVSSEDLESELDQFINNLGNNS